MKVTIVSSAPTSRAPYQAATRAKGRPKQSALGLHAGAYTEQETQCCKNVASLVSQDLCRCRGASIVAVASQDRRTIARLNTVVLGASTPSSVR